MSLTKRTVTDRIETVKSPKGDWFVLQVREANQILEDGEEISSSYHRYILSPDHDVSTITDSTVKAQFEAIMTESAKEEYIKFNKKLEKDCLARME